MFETDPKHVTHGATTSGADISGKQHPLDSDDNRRLHTILMGHLARELDRQYHNRLEMAADEAFYNHRQWDDADVTALEDRGQVPLTFNLIFTTINWILGAQQRQRTQYRILARRKDGVHQAELKTKYLKYLSDVNDAHFEVSAAYGEVVKAGLSFLETGLSFNTDGENIYENHTSWRDLLFDSAGRKADMSDGRYMFRLRWVDLDRAKAMFPKRAELLELSAERLSATGGLLDGLGDYPSDIHESSFFDNSYGLTQTGQDILPYDAGFAESPTGGLGYGYRPRVRLIEAWFREPKEAQFMRGGQFDGELYDRASIGHFMDLKQNGASISTRRAEMMKVGIMTRLGFLHSEDSPYRHNRFPFTPIWAYRDSDTGLPFGLIRGLRDPQRDINKRASKLLYLMSTKRVMVEDGAVEDIELLREEVARPDAIIQYKQGRPPPAIDTDLKEAGQNWQLMEFNQRMLEMIAGVNRDNLGIQTNAGKSGRAIIAHQEQGSLSVQSLTGNLSRGYREHGRKVLSNVEQFVSEERTIRITGERGPKYESVNARDDMTDSLTATKADFVVSEDQFSDTMRQQAVSSMLDLMQQLASTNPEIVGGVLDLLVESMDIPNHRVIVERIREITGMKDPDRDPDAPPTPEEQEEMEAEARAQIMGERMAESELALQEAKAASEAAKARKLETDVQRALSGMSMDQMNLLVQAVQSARDLVEVPAAGPAADQLVLEADLRSAERGGQ